MIAEKWNISREEMEEFALGSHEKAFAAIRAGHFENEIVPVGSFRTDEGPRESSLEKMAALKPLREGGRLTAAMASQISDGASAVLLASEQAVKDHKLTRAPASTTSAPAAPIRCSCSPGPSRPPATRWTRPA